MSPQQARLQWSGALAAAVGALAMIAGGIRAGLGEALAADLASLAVGWAQVVPSLVGVGALGTVFGVFGKPLGATPSEGLWLLVPGVVAWTVGWGLIARALQASRAVVPAPSAAVGAPLYSKIAKAKDFSWDALAAYGFGVLLAEVAFILAYVLLVAPGAGKPTTTGGLSPVWAFSVAFCVAVIVAFAGGFLGAAASKRLATPEATAALIYFGLPIPALLTAMHAVPALMTSVGYRLKEVVYLSSLLGENRPELGYWLVFAAFALSLFLGINFGFVANSSGKFDLRTSYEAFVSARHVSVFRPRLLLGVFSVLILGIVPPLIAFAIVSAAQAAADRTRIRKLGLIDPLLAAEALNELKLRQQTPTAMMTSLSVGGVGVGVMALIIVLSVMSGFEADLQKKILGTNAHGVVMKYSLDMPEYADVMDKIRGVRGVAGQTPFILNEVMISSEGNISGSMIKGIDPQTVGSVTDLPAYMLPGGSLEALDDPTKIHVKRLTPPPRAPKEDVPGVVPDIERDPMIDSPAPSGGDAEQEGPPLPGIVLGRELASSLKVVVGDRLNVVSPLGGELGPQGPMPKSRPFRVAGIFYSGMYEYDSKFVYIQLKEAQSFFGVKGASGVEIKVTDVDDARAVMRRIYDTLDGWPYRTKDWGEMNRNLFAALRLEKLVMGIILSIIIIVAAGLIVATVIMLVLEKRKEIAVLKALGVSDGGIVKIFLGEGLQIGIAGGVLGLVAGLAWCLFIEKVGIKLDPQVYYIPSLPVRIEPVQTMLSVVIAVLITFLASIYPALKAAQVEPVDGLKSE